jgi:CheY-like chemotaxis protein
MNTSRSHNTDSSPDLLLHGKQVLLAVACVDQGHLYLQFIQSAGAEVTLVCSGQSAVDSVRESPTRFDAVVMDFQMPELDGLDVTRQLRELGYSRPIIAVTAFCSESLKQSWFTAACNEFIAQPFEQTELISAVVRHTAAKEPV